MVDPDAPFKDNPIFKSWLHWIVGNVDVRLESTEHRLLPYCWPKLKKTLLLYYAYNPLVSLAAKSFTISKPRIRSVGLIASLSTEANAEDVMVISDFFYIGKCSGQGKYIQC